MLSELALRWVLCLLINFFIAAAMIWMFVYIRLSHSKINKCKTFFLRSFVRISVKSVYYSDLGSMKRPKICVNMRMKRRSSNVWMWIHLCACIGFYGWIRYNLAINSNNECSNGIFKRRHYTHAYLLINLKFACIQHNGQVISFVYTYTHTWAQRARDSNIYTRYIITCQHTLANWIIH